MCRAVSARQRSSLLPPSPWDEPLVRIHSSKERPAEANTAVHYHDYWFWIDDRDMKSKSEYLFILVLFSLAETGVAPDARDHRAR